MSYKINGTVVVDNSRNVCACCVTACCITGTTKVTVPYGPTANRPAAAVGLLYYDTDEGQLFANDGTDWSAAGGAAAAAGGLTIQSATDGDGSWGIMTLNWQGQCRGCTTHCSWAGTCSCSPGCCRQGNPYFHTCNEYENIGWPSSGYRAYWCCGSSAVTVVDGNDNCIAYSVNPKCNQFWGAGAARWNTAYNARCEYNTMGNFCGNNCDWLNYVDQRFAVWSDGSGVMTHVPKKQVAQGFWCFNTCCTEAIAEEEMYIRTDGGVTRKQFPYEYCVCKVNPFPMTSMPHPEVIGSTPWGAMAPIYYPPCCIASGAIHHPAIYTICSDGYGNNNYAVCDFAYIPCLNTPFGNRCDCPSHAFACGSGNGAACNTYDSFLIHPTCISACINCPTPGSCVCNWCGASYNVPFCSTMSLLPKKIGHNALLPCSYTKCVCDDVCGTGTCLTSTDHASCGAWAFSRRTQPDRTSCQCWCGTFWGGADHSGLVWKSKDQRYLNIVATQYWCSNCCPFHVKLSCNGSGVCCTGRTQTYTVRYHSIDLCCGCVNNRGYWCGVDMAGVDLYGSCALGFPTVTCGTVPSNFCVSICCQCQMIGPYIGGMDNFRYSICMGYGGSNPQDVISFNGTTRNYFDDGIWSCNSCKMYFQLGCWPLNPTSNIGGSTGSTIAVWDGASGRCTWACAFPGTVFTQSVMGTAAVRTNFVCSQNNSCCCQLLIHQCAFCCGYPLAGGQFGYYGPLVLQNGYGFSECPICIFPWGAAGCCGYCTKGRYSVGALVNPRNDHMIAFVDFCNMECNSGYTDPGGIFWSGILCYDLENRCLTKVHTLYPEPCQRESGWGQFSGSSARMCQFGRPGAPVNTFYCGALQKTRYVTPWGFPDCSDMGFVITMKRRYNDSTGQGTGTLSAFSCSDDWCHNYCVPGSGIVNCYAPVGKCGSIGSTLGCCRICLASFFNYYRVSYCCPLECVGIPVDDEMKRFMEYSLFGCCTMCSPVWGGCTCNATWCGCTEFQIKCARCAQVMPGFCYLVDCDFSSTAVTCGKCPGWEFVLADTSGTNCVTYSSSIGTATCPWICALAGYTESCMLKNVSNATFGGNEPRAISGAGQAGTSVQCAIPVDDPSWCSTRGGLTSYYRDGNAGTFWKITSGGRFETTVKWVNENYKCCC